MKKSSDKKRRAVKRTEKPRRAVKPPTIEAIDPSRSVEDPARAKKRVKGLQLDLLRLQTELRDRADFSVIVVFEGMDAAGKGGAIRRLTGKLDPRGFTVNAIGPPEEYEKRHHYLWRFNSRMPARGQIGIFDRSWYGRVLVERVEGYCSVAEWQRAYDEINDFERSLVDGGTPIVKLWLHVSKKEQLSRFRARQKDPFKEYKITPEDWRNRRRWKRYVEAANEMFAKTHTVHAPWNLVAGDDKWRARSQVLARVIEEMNMAGARR